MSIRPIDMQASVTRAQDISKSAELNTDKTALQEAFKSEMQKEVDRNMTKVIEANEIDKLVDENGHNKNNNKDREKRKKQEEQEKDKAQKEKEDLEKYQRMATQTGGVFDFKA